MQSASQSSYWTTCSMLSVCAALGAVCALSSNDQQMSPLDVTTTPAARPVALALVGSAATGLVLLAGTACVLRPDALTALTLVPPWSWVVAGVLTVVVA